MLTKEERYSKLIAGNLFFIKVLDDIGIKNCYVGYYYLIGIINLLINEDVKARTFYKNIYPVVAERFNKSVCTVERDIRTLINKCWNEQIKNVLNCKHLRCKPTCCKFIILIKNYILSLIH